MEKIMGARRYKNSEASPVKTRVLGAILIEY